MDKRASTPVRKIGESSNPHTGVENKPKLPVVKPTKITVVPHNHPVGPPSTDIRR